MSDLSYRLCEDCGEPEPFYVCNREEDPLDQFELAWLKDDPGEVPDPEDLAEERLIAELEEADPEEEWLRRKESAP